MDRTTRRVLLGLGAAGAALYAVHRRLSRFPPDDVPEGAYLRIATAVERASLDDAFPYLEEAAQVACYTIRDYARLAATAIGADYPVAQRERELPAYQRLVDAGEPPRVWARIAEDRGWLGRLRRDLSGVASIEIVGERATIVTARGTRYPFRRRPNGIWGLTMFTAQLDAEARRLARDWDLVSKAARDYRQAAKEH